MLINDLTFLLINSGRCDRILFQLFQKFQGNHLLSAKSVSTKQATEQDPTCAQYWRLTTVLAAKKETRSHFLRSIDIAVQYLRKLGSTKCG